jgi:hypothetical protein
MGLQPARRRFKFATTGQQASAITKRFYNVGG